MIGKCVECDKELHYQAKWCPRCNYLLDDNGMRIGYAGKEEPQAEDLVETVQPPVVGV